MPLAFALSAFPADGAERVRLQDNYDKALKEIWSASTPPIGSGFHIAPGKIVTAAHVVAGCRVVWARSSATSSAPAQIVALDTRADVALLDVPGLHSLPTLALGEAEIGRKVTLYGFPKRRGIVAKERVAMEAIVDAPTHSDDGALLITLRGNGTEGMSGGPVVDGAGAVVGLIVAKWTDGERPIAVATRSLRPFLDYMEIEARRAPAASPARQTETGEASPTSGRPRAPGIPLPRGAHMPEWTDAVMQVGCTR